MNFGIIALAALVPLITGFIWYNPKVFGTAWIKATGLTEDQLKSANMLKIFIFTYIMSFLASMSLQTLVIHQFGVYSTLMSEPGFNEEGSEVMLYFNDFMQRYGDNFRTFGHGALHGTFAGLLLALPVLGINALFERKSFTYIAIHTGYWMLTFALMGGIICAYA